MGIFGLAMMFAQQSARLCPGGLLSIIHGALCFTDLCQSAQLLSLWHSSSLKIWWSRKKSNSILWEPFSRLSDSPPYYTESVKPDLTAGPTRLYCLQLLSASLQLLLLLFSNCAMMIRCLISECLNMTFSHSQVSLISLLQWHFTQVCFFYRSICKELSRLYGTSIRSASASGCDCHVDYVTDLRYFVR